MDHLVGGKTISTLSSVGCIQQTSLVRANLVCSRLGLGGSRLHYLNPRGQQELLEAAYDCGINYFDVAPLYGHGLAERALGTFLKRHAAEREGLVVATKWGLPAAAWTDRIPEGALGSAVAMETLRRRFLGAPGRPSLTADLLVQSVEASLRRLGTSYIDILWMHEPEPRRIPDPASVLAALSNLRAAGKLRFFGFAGYSAHIEPTVEVFEQVEGLDLPFLRQCEEQSWSSEEVPDVTFGAISGGPQKRGASPIDSAIAIDRLRMALTRRARGVVLVSTTRPDNLRQMAKEAGTA